MSKCGRFGKYGDIKRIARLWQSKTWTRYTPGGQEKSRRGVPRLGKMGPQRLHVTIRRAKPLDADYIRTLSKKVFHRYGPYEDLLPHWFETGVTVTILALGDKKPVGFAMLSRPGQKWYIPRVSELLAIAVEPLRQRLGVGDRLMRAVLGATYELQVKRLVLHTDLNNLPGQGLFKKYGFIPLETKQKFYVGGQDALMMYKDIE